MGYEAWVSRAEVHWSIALAVLNTECTPAITHAWNATEESPKTEMCGAHNITHPKTTGKQTWLTN